MGRFNSAHRHAADSSLPLPVRYVKFIETCSAFGRLAGMRLQPVHDALADLFGFSRTRKPDAEQITSALATMVQVRFRLLHLLADGRLQKRKRKAAGNRAKQPAAFSPVEVLELLIKSGLKRRMMGDRSG